MPTQRTMARQSEIAYCLIVDHCLGPRKRCWHPYFRVAAMPPRWH